MWKFIVDVVHDFGSSLWLDVGRVFLHVSNVLLLLLMKIYFRAFTFRLYPWLHTLGSETTAWVSTQPGVPTNVLTSRSARILQTVYTVEINYKLFLSPLWRPRLTTHANLSMSGCSQRTNNVITASLIYQNDVATSFGINNDVVITLRSAASCFCRFLRCDRNKWGNSVWWPILATICNPWFDIVIVKMKSSRPDEMKVVDPFT